MQKMSSRESTLWHDMPMFVTSGPQESDWGQPAASQYRFELDGDRLFGQQIARVYLSTPIAAATSAGDIYLDATASSWTVVGTEMSPFPKTQVIPDLVIESDVDNMEWLALAESSFDFWDNAQDALYDDL